MCNAFVSRETASNLPWIVTFDNKDYANERCHFLNEVFAIKERYIACLRNLSVGFESLV